MPKLRNMPERQPDEAMRDQCDFVLEPEEYDAFLALLDAPARPDARLIELMSRKAPWEL